MDNKYVIITGAYGGLGKALANTYAAAGYGLILLGRKKEALIDLKKEFSQEIPVHIFVTDVSDLASCQNTYDDIKKQNLNIKVLINNAGITYIKKFDKNYDLAQYQQLINTNLNGTVYMSKLFIDDLLKNKGSLINISSVIGYAPVVGRTAYAASKFGMEGFSSVLRTEWPDQLQVLVVYPTFIATDIRNEVEGDKTINEVLTAESVADSILKAQNQGKERLFLGKTAKLSYYLYKYFPKLYVNLMRKKTNDIS